MTLSDVATSYEPKNNVETTLKVCWDAKQILNTLLTNFLKELIKQIGKLYEIKCRKPLSQIMRRTSLILKQHVFIKVENNPSDKVFIVDEGLENIGDIEDLPRFMFIDEECGNLK